MLPWLSTLKAVLPLATELVSKTLPAFTARRADKTADVVPQQIAELQSAATENAESVKLLAEQLQRTVLALEEGTQSLAGNAAQLKESVARADQSAAQLQQQIGRLESGARRSFQVSVAALAVALIALGTAAIVVLR